MVQQPFLHNLVPTISAPNQVWSDESGDIATGAQGVYCYDTRLIRTSHLSLDGVVIEPVQHFAMGTGVTRFIGALRVNGDTADPKILLIRDIHVNGDGIRETVRIENQSSHSFDFTAFLDLAADATAMESIKTGDSGTQSPLTLTDDASWTDGKASCRVTLDAGGQWLQTGRALRATWALHLDAFSSTSVSWNAALSDQSTQFVASSLSGMATHATRHLTQTRSALSHLLRQASADLDSLMMADRHSPSDSFFAAGAPWFFTLFGRDSLIAAWLSRHEIPEVSLGTLRVLASRQGTRHDPATGEQPGKILHEVRRDGLETFDAGGHLSLPPVYFGTIDATPLWVRLFAALWQDGYRDELADLIPHLRAALEWIVGPGDADGDLFLEYIDATNSGLANQGWKDSGDSIRWQDGTIATAPIALCEAQGYAYAALTAGATILNHEGIDSARYVERAEAVKEKFAQTFWIRDNQGRYPVIALDGDKKPVTGIASNMGHLLGTGILNEGEAEEIVERLCHADMLSPYGIRTLSESTTAFHSLSYHCGSVWTHDNAMIIDGMLAENMMDPAREVAERLLSAAPYFHNQMPELFAVLTGTGLASHERSAAPSQLSEPLADQCDRALASPPVPYPASCHPQAWAAASALTIAHALRQESGQTRS